MPTVRRIKKGRSFERDEQGRFRWRVQFTAPNGKRTSRIVWLHTEQEALEYVTTQQGKKMALPWSKAVALFQQENGKTLEVETQRARNLHSLISYLGDIEVEETTLKQFDNFMRHIDNGNGNVGNKARIQLLSVARYARRRGLIDRIPFEFIGTLPVKVINKRRAFKPEQLAPYIQALDPWARRFFLFLLYSGERVSACSRIRVADLSDEGIAVTIKGGRERILPWTDAIRGVVNESRSESPEGALFVFVNRKGSKWNKDSFRRNCERTWKAAGLPHIRPHELRHSFGTMAGRMFGADMVRAGMGHLSRQTSEQYVHPDVEMAETVAAKVSKCISDAIGEQKASK